MCFSAGASFSAAALLTGVGAASIYSSTSRAGRLFAATPLLFAVQQGVEGVVWTTLGDESHRLVHSVAVNAFLTVALIVWPVWLPLSLRRVEENPGRAHWLLLLRYFGIAVAIVSAFLLVRHRASVTVVGHSLHYDFAGRQNTVLSVLMLLAYVTPTIIPLWISTAKFARQIGVMLVVSIVAATWIEREALTSVWCFFSSLLSGTILISVRESRNRWRMREERAGLR